MCPNQTPPEVHYNHYHQVDRLQFDRLEYSQGYYRFCISLTEPTQAPITSLLKNKHALSNIL